MDEKLKRSMMEKTKDELLDIVILLDEVAQDLATSKEELRQMLADSVPKPMDRNGKVVEMGDVLGERRSNFVGVCIGYEYGDGSGYVVLRDNSNPEHVRHIKPKNLAHLGQPKRKAEAEWL